MRAMLLLFVVLVAQNVQNVEAKTIEVMSYNVENLFDSEHDEGKSDWSFLPKNYPGKKEACKKENSKYRREECLAADWTAVKVGWKVNQIVDVVKKERNTTPDILALVEVENPIVVGMVAKALGYANFEMTTSPDNRGVDVALLYKSAADVKKISHKEHIVAVDYPTRNILEVEFLIGNYPLTIFVNHWPSLANPDSWRIKAAEVLANRTIDIAKTNGNMNFIAVGDFNTIPENNPHPFKTVIHKNDLYLDTAETFLADKTISEEAKKKLSPGSYYYPAKNQWNMLDRIFFSKNLKDNKGLEILISSFEIYLPDFALTEKKVGFRSDKKRKEGGYEMDDEEDFRIIKVPKRFNSSAKSQSDMGYSDHFTVRVKLNIPEVIKK